jgi:ABC-type phosphate/phosphonate transport system substrate-binding protein
MSDILNTIQRITYEAPTLDFCNFSVPVLYKTCLYITEYLEQLTAIPVLQDQKSHYQHTPHALSDIVVRKSSSFTTVDDLQACVWACCIKGYREKSSYAEYQFMHETFFEQMPFRERIITCSHLQSLRLLLEGTVDVATIDSHLLDEIFEQSAKMNSLLRIIGSFNDRTVPPVVFSTQVDALLRQHMRDALLSMHQDTFFGQRLHESSIERFLPVTDAYYELIRGRYRKAQAPCNLS